MPTVQLLTTVWVCNFCGRGDSRTGTDLVAVQHFIDTLGWRLLDGDTVVCDRCRLLPDVTHTLLQQAKAQTL